MDDSDDEPASEASIDLDFLELLNSRDGEVTARTTDVLGLGRRRSAGQLVANALGPAAAVQTSDVSSAEHERAALRAIIRALQVGC